MPAVFFHFRQDVGQALRNIYFARGSGCEVLCGVRLFVCLSVREDISGTTRAIFTNLLCVLPMSVARSFGTLTIGRIAHRREGGDGSAERGRSVTYDCLVIVTSLFGSRPSDHYFRSVCLSDCLSVCLFVQSFFQPSSIRFGSN